MTISWTEPTIHGVAKIVVEHAWPDREDLESCIRGTIRIRLYDAEGNEATVTAHAHHRDERRNAIEVWVTPELLAGIHRPHRAAAMQPADEDVPT